jgi:hypothetical protein
MLLVNLKYSSSGSPSEVVKYFREAVPSGRVTQSAIPSSQYSQWDMRPDLLLPAPSNTCPNPVFDVMSTANSPHGAAGASPPHQDVLNSKKAVKFADLQFSGVSCRDISDLPVQWCWSNTSEMRYMRYHLVVRRCSKPRSCQCILWRHLRMIFDPQNT